MKIKLNKTLESSRAADSWDVRQVKHALNRLGYYVPYEKTGMTGYPDSHMFAALPWRIGDPKTGAFASEELIAESYRALRDYARKHSDKDGEMNRTAKQQKEITPLRLHPDERKKLFQERLAIAREELTRNINKNRAENIFKCFPPDAKIALIDMQFNMGSSNFNEKKWPNLFTAARLRDWIMAAHESRRKDVNAKRNGATFGYFMEAAEREETYAQEDDGNEDDD